jgi:hypothetical protein
MITTFLTDRILFVMINQFCTLSFLNQRISKAAINFANIALCHRLSCVHRRPSYLLSGTTNAHIYFVGSLLRMCHR